MKNVNALYVLQKLTYQYDMDNPDQLISDIIQSLDTLKSEPHKLHGLMKERIFWHIAKSLGNCVFIKKEDEGLLYSAVKIKCPDYFLILKDGTQIYVEVKNHHKNNDFSLKDTYVTEMLKFPGISEENLKFCIFWSKQNTWTLTSIKRFNLINKKYLLNFGDALQYNEMSKLGDKLIVVCPPIKVEIIPSKNNTQKTKIIGNNVTQSTFIIKNINIFINNNHVDTSTNEGRLLYSLIFKSLPVFQSEGQVIIKDNIIEKVIFDDASLSNGEKNGQIVGSLSEIITSSFIERSKKNNKINKIEPIYDDEIYKMLLRFIEEEGKHILLIHCLPHPD